MKRHCVQLILLSSLAILLLMPPSAAAQSANELAKQTQNPVANLISVPLQGNWDFGLGDRGATGTLLNVQPIMPFAFNKSTSLVLRVIMPVMSQPAPDGTRINGLGDAMATAFFSTLKTGRIIWGAGPVVMLPSATNKELGSEKLGLGPSAVALVQPGKFTVGLLFNHVWSVAGPEDRTDVNQSYFQPFSSYNLGGGLSLGIASEISVNWKADQKCTAPLLFSVSKILLLAKRPMNVQVGAGPILASPDGGAEWRFRLAVSFLYPR